MRFIQFTDQEHTHRVARVESYQSVEALVGEHSLYRLATEAISRNLSLRQIWHQYEKKEMVDYGDLVESRSLLSPIHHSDPAHVLITGTGLTHLGSAQTRSQMHEVEKEELTDSMKMFRWGIEGGKPGKGQTGVQPEWFYKGDGSWLVRPYHPIPSPAFALDHGEEPEIAGIYLIGPDGSPFRIGFALGNEFSDHITEKQNYLYLAHSKLRPCAIGPELLTGKLPLHIEGQVWIHRNQEIHWESTFLSGENNMSHTIANLEYHHFKYPRFRRPGDIHIHFFGTATLSFAAGIQIQAGDEIEISAPQFGRSLRTPIEVEPALPVAVRML